MKGISFLSTGNGRGTKYHLYASNISNVASNSTKQRLSQDELYNLICNNCKDYPSLEELAQRVNKNSKYLQNHILKDMISNNLNRKTISRKPRTSQPKIQKEIVSYSIYFTKNHYLCTLLSEITKSTYIIWKRNSKEPPSPRHCLMPTVRCTLAIWQVYMFLQISMYAIFA